MTADCEIDGVSPGENLAAKFKPATAGVWEWKLSQPLRRAEKSTLTVSIKDQQGNINRIDRTFTAE